MDWDKRQATCPRGNTSTWWSPATQRGTKAIVIKFDKETCRPCPVRDQCTLENGRPDPLPATPRAARSPRRCPPPAGRRAVVRQVGKPARASKEPSTKQWQSPG
ncbi:transposase [Streptomyces sp. NBC_01207]|uniref:transposase n=1 Tax=Streptomyces sp. NBC_01207 TaxID=2903772 RepID=UPI002E138639|nr:transposase [Streptomyces sp. NBC_01207]